MKKVIYSMVIIILTICNSCTKPAILSNKVGSLEGVVFDMATKDTVFNATIRIKELNLSGKSNWNGKFNIPNVPYGVYTIIAEMPIYQTYTLSNVEIKKREKIKIHLKMDKNSIVVKESIRNNQNIDSLKHQFFGGVYGLIVAKETREPLNSEIRLESIDNTITAKSDSSGWFYMGYVPYGLYNMKVMHAGYDTTVILGIKVDVVGWQRYILRLNESNPVRQY